MNTAAVVTMFLGVLIVAIRCPLLIVPGVAIRHIHTLTATHARVRGLGCVLAVVAGMMLWAGNTEDGGLASFLLVIGVVMLFLVVPWLLLFPQTYKGLVATVLPDNPTGSLIGWRLLGLIGMLIGGMIFYAGLRH